jgi:hypothetical protein
MRILATRKEHQNDAALDPWTVVHFAAGLALGLMEVPRGPAVAAAVAYEVAEQLLERHEVGQELFETSGPEKTANAAVDVIALGLGHELGRRWNRT